MHLIEHVVVVGSYCYRDGLECIRPRNGFPLFNKKLSLFVAKVYFNGIVIGR